MNATTFLLSKDSLANKAGAGLDFIDWLLASKQIRPAFQCGHSLLFHVEQVGQVKAAVVRKTDFDCPRLLSSLAVIRDLKLPHSRLFRAIVAGRITPDFATVAKRPSYFFEDDPARLEALRAVLVEKVARRRYRTKRRFREGDFFEEANSGA